MSLNLRAGAIIAAVLLVLFVILPRASSGHQFKKTAVEYDCRVKIADDPGPVNQQVLARVAIKCATAPQELDFVVQLQFHESGNQNWVNAGDARKFTGSPGPDYSDVSITQPCKAGSWRVAYQLMGVGAEIGKNFQEAQQFGDGKDISKSQCDNS